MLPKGNSFVLIVTDNLHLIFCLHYIQIAHTPGLVLIAGFQEICICYGITVNTCYNTKISFAQHGIGTSKFYCSVCVHNILSAPSKFTAVFTIITIFKNACLQPSAAFSYMPVTLHLIIYNQKLCRYFCIPLASAVYWYWSLRICASNQTVDSSLTIQTCVD